MKFEKSSLLLYAVTPKYSEHLISDVKMALEGGITCLQLRQKELTKYKLLKLATELKKLCEEYYIPFIVNDDLELALECGADGVHLGLSDGSIKAAREKAGNDFIIGASAHNKEEAVKAESEGASYLGVGSAFISKSKEDAVPISPEMYKEIVKSINIPIVAIGGIDKNNIINLKDTGISGVALINSIFGAENIKADTGKMLKKISVMIGRQI